MPAPGEEQPQPSRARIIFATIIVVLTVLLVWAAIEYRSQPPPPPNPVGARGKR